MKIKSITSGYAQTNTYFLSKGNKMIVIDPCIEVNNNPSALYEKIEGKDVIAILITHAHYDHITGIDALVEKTSAKVYAYKEEITWFKDNVLNLANMFPEPLDIKSNIIPIEFGTLNFDDFNFEVLATPGHTKGSISYKIDNHIFDGDFIFMNSVGRTDLYSGNSHQMKKSLKEFVAEYKEQDIHLYPGHGPATTLKREIKNNPYILEVL